VVLATLEPEVALARITTLAAEKVGNAVKVARQHFAAGVAPSAVVVQAVVTVAVVTLLHASKVSAVAKVEENRPTTTKRTKSFFYFFLMKLFVLFVVVGLFSSTFATALTLDACNKVTTATVTTACTTTADGATPAAKCCLATFTALPTFSAANVVIRASATSGSKVASTTFSGCYKTGGSILLLTGAAGHTTSASNGVEGYFAAADFCGTGKTNVA
jgi:hypothetical protein